MKLQRFAVAAALLASVSAHASIAGGGNGSLVMIAYDKNLSGAFSATAGVFDLGLTIDDVIGASGNGSGVVATAALQQGVAWDFINNTIKIGGVVTSFGGTNDWTAAWNRLLANVDAADLTFVITAFDTVGVGAAQRSLVTGRPDATAHFTTVNASGLQQIAAGKVNDIFTPIANRGTIASVANGAYTFTSADGVATRSNGYVMAGDAFANEWRNNNVLQGETLASNITDLYVVDGTGKSLKLGLGLSLSAASGVLTNVLDYNYGLDHPVSTTPEPGGWALLAAGLAVVGSALRRQEGTRRAV